MQEKSVEGTKIHHSMISNGIENNFLVDPICQEW